MAPGTGRAVDLGAVTVLYVRALPGADEARDLARTRLTPEERVRFERFIPDEPRIHFVTGRILLRKTLGLVLGIEPRDVAFQAGKHGKLALAGEIGATDLTFNLTHTAGCVAMALTRGRAVGVDAEKIDARRATRDVARISFSPAENEALSGLEGAAYTQAFFRHWTLKEAYLKARGIGLGLPLTDFGVTLPSEATGDIHFHAKPEVDRNPRRWTFEQRQLADAWMLAVCFDRLTGGPIPIVWRETER